MAEKVKKAPSSPTPERTARLFATKLSKFTKSQRKEIVKQANAMLRLAEKLNK